jgi:tryptophan-rich sensory protein
MQPKFKNILALTGFFVACFSVSVIGALITMSSVETWYPALVKPSFNPPAWVFGPVWSLLYAMMAIAAWRVWLIEQSPDRNRDLMLFFVQLGLNLLWSILFFGYQQVGLALANIVILLVSIFITARLFYRCDSIAGWLLVPYILWVSFATLLNFSIWILN